MLDLYKYITPFIIGGSVISGSKFLSSYMTPAIGSLVGGMPTGIISSFFIGNDNAKRDYYEGYVYHSFILFLSVLGIHLMSIHSAISMNVISGVGFILWAIISYLLLNFLGLTKKVKSAK